MAVSRHDAILGCLLGGALGDSLGLPAEGLSARTIARRFGDLDRHRLLFRTGFVSDDTELSALVAEAIVVARRGGGLDEDLAVRRFRRGLAGWVARLPFGVGFATLRAGARVMLGFRRPGVRSAGNGAAMRAPVLGVALADEPELRRRLGRRIAEVTHVDERAVQGALWIAEVAALAARADAAVDRATLAREALEVVTEPSLRAAIERGLRGDEPARNSGFVLNSCEIVAGVFARHGDDPHESVRAAIRVGGDTDTHASMAGALAGVLVGAGTLPRSLIDAIHDGPFGPSHLRALSAALASPGAEPPSWSATFALARNLALYPVILAHGLRRIAPR